MESIALGVLFVTGIGVLVIGALLLRALKPKSAAAVAPSQAAGLTHGQMFDQAEGLGDQLVSGGYMTDADWQPIIEAVAKSLTRRHLKAPEAPAAI